MKLEKNFITNEEFEKLYNTIGVKGISNKYGVPEHQVRIYKKKYFPLLKLDIRALRKRQSAELVRHFNNERRLRNEN